MRHLHASILVLVCVWSVYAASPRESNLPETWTKDFIVTLSFTGSMDGSSTHIEFTYDSCKYLRQVGMEAPEESQVKLTETDRAEILKKLHELNVDKIDSEVNIAPVNDGWTSSLCFGTHCVSSGPGMKMSEDDQEQFSKAYDYLEGFAAKKAKFRKKK